MGEGTDNLGELEFDQASFDMVHLSGQKSELEWHLHHCSNQL